MDRVVLKERAKQNYHKQTGAAIAVAFIMSLFGGGFSYSGGFTFKNTFSYNGNSDSVQDYENAFSNMVNSGIFAGILVFALIAGLIALGVSIFIAPIFKVGGNRFFLKLRKDASTDVSEVLGNFKDGNYMNIVGIMFVKGLFIYLWTLLLVIPGIIKALEYMMIDYILAVRPDIDRKSAFNMSKALMDGHKGDAFILELSFLGWILLSGFTCGILAIAYVNPYIQATFAEFYGLVRDDALRRGVITEADLPDYQSNIQNPQDNFYNNLPRANDNTFYGDMQGNNYGYQNLAYNNPNGNVTPPPATPVQPADDGNIPYNYDGNIQSPPTAPDNNGENENQNNNEQ